MNNSLIAYLIMMLPVMVSCAQPLAELLTSRIKQRGIRIAIMLIITIMVIAINMAIIVYNWRM